MKTILATIGGVFVIYQIGRCYAKIVKGHYAAQYAQAPCTRATPPPL